MMDSTINAATSAKFSWHRVGLVYAYNAPWVNRQLALYLAISFIPSLLILLPYDAGWIKGLYNIVKTALTWMYMMSPLVFLKGGDPRLIDRQVPATPAEKYIFYMIYLIPVMLVACFGFPIIAENLYARYCRMEGSIADGIRLAMDLPTDYVLSEYIALVATMLTVFCVMMKSRSNRAVKGILVGIAAAIICSTIYNLHGMKEAIMMGYNEAAGITAVTTQREVNQQVTEAINSHSLYSSVALAILSLYSLLMLWYDYRVVKRGKI